MITAAWMVDKEVVVVNENESSERVKIHAAPAVRYRGTGLEGLQKMGEEFEAENEGMKIPTRGWLMANRRTIKERMQKDKLPHHRLSLF